MKIKTTIRGGLVPLQPRPIIGRGCGGGGIFPVLQLAKTIVVE
ncbi:hypothetical protein [Archangium sp. Cb G35]|nr:hypothetical protein [Archangium sp. Cb G35]